jgi:hypothetical protein
LDCCGADTGVCLTETHLDAFEHQMVAIEASTRGVDAANRNVCATLLLEPFDQVASTNRLICFFWSLVRSSLSFFAQTASSGRKTGVSGRQGSETAGTRTAVSAR